MDNLKYSIITVCFNADKVIEKTIQSVLAQSYSNFDYIIVDGASTDTTLETVKKYAENDSRIRYVSEPDNGLYDAMNKGIRMATGDYIEILNAGDSLHEPETLMKLSEIIAYAEADIFYGNIMYMYPDGHTDERIYSQFCQTKFYYLLGDCINHQAIFAHRSCFSDENFDLSIKYSADRDWMIRQKKAGKTFRAVNMIVCDYSLDPESVSVLNNEKVFEESRIQVKKYFPGGYFVYFIIDKIRHGKLSAVILHKLYEKILLRKQ